MIIGKFELATVDRQVVEIPQPAQILSVIEQYGVVVLYALMEKGAPLETKTIDIYGTGHTIPKPASLLAGKVKSEPGTFIGTVSTEDGALIWHVFDSTDAV